MALDRISWTTTHGVSRRWLGLLAAASTAALVVVVATGRLSHALTSFGGVAPLSSNAANGGFSGGLSPGRSLAGDGNGNWVAVWGSDDPLDGTLGNDMDVLVARSSDNGATWSAASALNSDAATDNASGDNLDFGPHVATDGSGTWIVVWRRDSFEGAAVARSFDNGATWTTIPVPIALQANPGAIVCDGADTWVIVFLSGYDLGGTIGDDFDIVFVRSTDDGATWSAPAPVNSDAATDFFDDSSPHLATDGAGTWIAVWDGSGIEASTSTDNGATWGPVVLASSAGAFYVSSPPRIATDGIGKWIVVWHTDRTFGDPFVWNLDIVFAESVDNGATWTVAAHVNTDPEDRGDYSPDIGTDGLGSWYVVWTNSGLNVLGKTTGKDRDIGIARSTDNGVTWTNTAALNANASRDKGVDSGPRLAYDGQGHWITAWLSNDSLRNTIGDDLDVLVATSSDDCPLVPASGCLTALKTSVDLRDREGGKDSFVWKWSKGEATTIVDFGDPTASTDYVACLYDDVSGSPRLELEMDMTGGALCKLKPKPCWQARPSGFRYKDGRREHGAVKTLTLRAGAGGKAAIKLRAKAPTLGPPRLPLSQSPTVTLQLHNLENGRCWETAYSTALTNDAERFKAKAP